jgi:hypothetical protein
MVIVTPLKEIGSVNALCREPTAVRAAIGGFVFESEVRIAKLPGDRP